MKKQIFLGLLLVGLTGLNAKPRTLINRMPINKRMPALSGKNHTKSWKATSGLIASKITPKVNSLQQAQTKFVKKIMPAVYEFAADYIQIMHPVKAHKVVSGKTHKTTVTKKAPKTTHAVRPQNGLYHGYYGSKNNNRWSFYPGYNWGGISRSQREPRLPRTKF